VVYVYFKFGFAALAVLMGFAAYAVRTKRGVLGWAAAASAIAGASAHYQAFWTLTIFALMVPWALVCAGSWIDLAWRARAGFVAALALFSGLALYPTYIDERFERPDIDPTWTSEQQAEFDTKSRVGENGFGRFFRANIPFRLVRGLDLKGGFRVEYTVDVAEAIKDKRDRYYDDLRTQIARTFGYAPEGSFPTNEQLAKISEKARVEKPRDDASKLVVTFNADDDAAKINDDFLARFVRELDVLRSGDKKTLTFRIKKDVENQVRDQAVAQAKDKILRRVDSLGLKEASVSTRDEDIVVEVPGNDRRQFESIKEIISQTARLEFNMLDDEADFFSAIAKDQESGKRPDCDEQGIRFRYEDAPIGPGKSKPVRYAVMERRDGEKLVDTLKRFKSWTTTLSVPDTHQVVFGKLVDFDEEKDTWEEIGWRSYYVQSRADVTGDMIRDAQAGPDQGGGPFSGWQVNMDFTPLGADRFEQATGNNINKRFAIILDDKVESAPVIQGKIAGGSARITMGRNNPQQQLADAKKLELVLRSGALPAPIEYKGEQQIGPSLGTDAIAQGLRGAAAGAGLVLVFMFIIYVRAGLIANVAVLLNLVLQFAILAMFGASLTLPGIAGLALTLGIAVDANVLINERIRDEIRHGKSPRQAVDIGYDRAFSAIIDGHVTTLISSLILFQYGSGPIKGFAVTLIIGMITSIFTGVVCTRLVFDWVVRWRKAKQLSLG
jgi:preprotein translocase subunit SecD